VGSFDILRQLSVFALGQTFLLGSCPWWAVKALWAGVKGKIINWPLLVVAVIACREDRGERPILVTEVY